MAKSGAGRKPVSRKKNRQSGGAKRGRSAAKRPPIALPRPDKFTFVIIGVGVLVAAGLMFFAVRNTSAAAESAATDLTEAEAALNLNRSRLAEHDANQVYSGAALAAVVGPAEAYLPSAEGAANVNEQVLAVTNSAEAAGLSVDNFSTEGEFVEAGGAQRYDFPLTVSGSPAALTAWLDALYAQQPLVTFTTDGASFSPSGANATLKMSLWLSNDPEWSSGRSSGASLEGLNGLTGGAGG